MRRRVPELLTARARELRTAAMDVERLLWLRLRHYRRASPGSWSLADVFLDFACRQAKLAVELDGAQHIEAAAYDTERTRWLEGQGWRVIRLWNDEVRENPDGVAEHILLAAAECLGSTHPQPLPSREGRRGVRWLPSLPSLLAGRGREVRAQRASVAHTRHPSTTPLPPPP